MPIKPENRHRYPPRKAWQKIRADILARAKNCCEHCGVKNYAVGYWNGKRFVTLQHTMQDETFALECEYKIIRIVLTIAHLDQMPENNNPQNLAALCQRCHLAHDKPFHIKNRRITLFKKTHAKKGMTDLFGFGGLTNVNTTKIH